MKLNLPKSIVLLSLAGVLASQAAEINPADYSLIPDGQNLTTTFQNTNINIPNGGTVLPASGTPVVYVVSTFTFGEASDAHLRFQFFVNEASAPRLGLEIQDTGLVQFIGTGDTTRTNFNLNQDMAGETVTVLAKLSYDANNNVTYGKANAADDTLMNVWINPTSSSAEGSGLTAGDMSTIWNSAGFNWFRQIIQNQNTPGTAGASSITNTTILTGDDAHFAVALSLATGEPPPPPGVVNANVSTVVASPGFVPADGVTESTITVTLKDAYSDPVAARLVTLETQEGAVITPVTPVETDAAGMAVFTVKSGTPETATFTAKDVTDDPAIITITQTASVVFLSSADPGLSTVAASPAFVPADGSSTSTITVTVRGLGSVPLEGKEVTLANTAGPQAAVISPLGAVTTDANGVANFTVSSSTSGAEQFTATVVTDSVVITQTATVNFVGPADAITSTVTASSGMVVANGTASSIITVSLKDANGFAVVGHNVTLANTAGPQASTINPLTAVATNASGVATFTVSSSTLGTEVFTATDTTDSVVVSQTASVEFVDSTTPLAFHVSFVQFTPSLGDFEDPASLNGPGGGSGEIWNQIRAASGSNLLASNGAATSFGVVTTFTECRQRSTTGFTLLNDGLTDFGRNFSRTVTISGLPPGSLYNVWLASTANFDLANERAKGTFSTSNATGTVGDQPIDQSVSANTTTWEEGNNHVLFESVVVDGSGQISITAASAVDHRLPLSGFQLAPVGRALITSFEAAGEPGVIDQDNKTITVNVPSDTNLSTLAPTFTLTTGTCVPVSGSPPSPTFAVQNPATYIVTDDSTDPATVNEYTVTIIVEAAPPATTTLVIDLGTSPVGTFIQGGQFIGSGPTNLPLPALPAGSILRSIAVDAKLEATSSENIASDLALLFDTAAPLTGDAFSLGLTSPDATQNFGPPTEILLWAGGNGGVGTSLTETRTDIEWTGDIDLASIALFLGNAYSNGNGTWSGTITLTYDVVPTGTPFGTWSGGAAPEADTNGDGVANAIAWALGAVDPDEDALGLLPVIDNTSDPDYLLFTFDRGDAANNDSATAIAVEYGSDLVGWTTAVDNGDDVIIDVTPGTPKDAVVVKLKRSTLGANGKIFARLKVVITE